MKLILTQDVEGLGAPGDVVEVKDGYGRNYLVPRGFGIAATKGAEKHVESLKRARELREVRSLGDARLVILELPFFGNFLLGVVAVGLVTYVCSWSPSPATAASRCAIPSRMQAFWVLNLPA